MLIKSLTLHQPWASFMALGLKRNETRSWSTSYRGPLAIHAAAILHPREIPNDVMILAMEHFGHWRSWPKGKIMCVVNNLRCWPTSYVSALPGNEMELVLGDYSPGRYWWETAMLQIFDEPIPAKGKQGLWDWEWPEALKVRELP